MAASGVYTLLLNATSTNTGESVSCIDAANKTFQATVTGTGAVSATVVIEVSNHPSLLGWMELGTISLSGTTSASDGFASLEAWAHVRARISAISGTNAAVTTLTCFGND